MIVVNRSVQPRCGHGVLFRLGLALSAGACALFVLWAAPALATPGVSSRRYADMPAGA
jgi:hypothetical protein